MCVDSNLLYRDIHNAQKNVNHKNIIQKGYECKEQTYNYLIYLIWFEYDIKMKELSKPENFKMWKKIKLLKKEFMCIELKMHLLLAFCIKFFANNSRTWRKVSFMVWKKWAKLDQYFKSSCIFNKKVVSSLETYLISNMMIEVKVKMRISLKGIAERKMCICWQNAHYGCNGWAKYKVE